MKASWILGLTLAMSYFLRKLENFYRNRVFLQGELVFLFFQYLYSHVIYFTLEVIFLYWEKGIMHVIFFLSIAHDHPNFHYRLLLCWCSTIHRISKLMLTWLQPSNSTSSFAYRYRIADLFDLLSDIPSCIMFF